MIENFITDNEAETIKALALPKLARSRVSDDEIEDSRTSYSAMFNNNENPLITGIVERAAKMVNQPINFVEGMQVVHYEKGQQFEPHYDFFDEELKNKKGSQRVFTFLVYLNDINDEMNGYTIFPKLDLKILPKKNAAIFWRNLDEKMNEDYRTLHGGLPLNSGEKWAINIWIDNKSQL